MVSLREMNARPRLGETLPTAWWGSNSRKALESAGRPDSLQIGFPAGQSNILPRSTFFPQPSAGLPFTQALAYRARSAGVFSQ